MDIILAAAGIAEASGAEQLLFLAIAFGPMAALLIAMIVGSIRAVRTELPPEDYGETSPDRPHGACDHQD